MSTNVKFLLVQTGTRHTPAREPLVIAVSDNHLVKFSRRDGWTCDCTTEGDECSHVDAAVELLDDKVLGDEG